MARFCVVRQIRQWYCPRRFDHVKDVLLSRTKCSAGPTKMKEGLKIFHQILREMRLSLPKGTASQDASYQHVVKQFQTYQLTPDKVCRDPKAAFHQASTYLCYLQSTRRNQELLKTYKGVGERSIADSANLVGLKLPKLPTDQT